MITKEDIGNTDDVRPERNLRVLASKKKSSGKKKGIAEAPNPSRLSIVH